MTKYLYLLSSILLLINFSCKNTTKETVPEDLLSYVDPFIGTGGHGHTFPGPVAPFGMVQPSPDNGRGGWDWCSGYHISDSLISGFALTHLSGTGIGDLADVLVMPTKDAVDVTLLGKTRDSLPYTSRFLHETEKALPGYYKVHLEDTDVMVELTANEYVAFHRYTYTNAMTPSFVVDLGYAVNWDKPLETAIEQVNDTTITGYRYSTGWAKNQKLFFIIESSQPITKSDINKINEQANGGQFYLGNADEVELKIAYSSVSIANAKENLLTYGVAKHFNEVKTEVQKTWENTLSKIKIETPVDSLKTIFYSALYHTQVSPSLFSDVNGEFRLQNDSIVTAQGYKAYSSLSLWDIFRAETPLLNILQPQVIDDVVSSMLSYYDEKGDLPVWTLYGNETNTMTGYHSVSVIADAYVKGNRGYNVKKAYEAVKHTMMGDDRGLKFYKEFGFIPYTAIDESVTISLEYAYNDWCVAQMAKDLGKEEDYRFFTERSKAYTHLFDAESGFMRGKSEDDTAFREPFDPALSNHRVDTDYTEGNAYQHSWFVPHDVKGLVKAHGGDKVFNNRLENLFTVSSELSGDNTSPDISGLIGQYAHGNEPSHHIAYMFNSSNAAYKTQEYVREILNTQYSTQPDGLSGNEDCGQMSAWYVFSALGFYPMNPASATYELGSPLFTKATIQVADDVSFTILAPETSAENIYVQGVTLNGEPLKRTYITHQELMKGGTLTFTMANTPNKSWGNH